ncbi:hypothetical protein ACFQY7_55495 [Actinomadura luteofluorescens]|uniref:hypothetical protein n=1 Tax=Actinomadura luteofluorescens TaxID=46163 RepID=UPI0036385316
MGDARHPAFRRPAARLLVVVLGLLGFVAGPVGAGMPAGGVQGRASSTGTISGVRIGAVHQGPARTRTATKTRTAGRTQSAIAATALHAAGPRRRTPTPSTRRLPPPATRSARRPGASPGPPPRTSRPTSRRGAPRAGAPRPPPQGSELSFPGAARRRAVPTSPRGGSP